MTTWMASFEGSVTRFGFVAACHDHGVTVRSAYRPGIARFGRGEIAGFVRGERADLARVMGEFREYRRSRCRVAGVRVQTGEPSARIFGARIVAGGAR